MIIISKTNVLDLQKDTNLSLTIPNSSQSPLIQFLPCLKGWGHTRNDDIYNDKTNKTHEVCFTNNNGPNRHTMCRFPFFYKGMLYNQCLKTPSPSSGNRRCRQFKADKGKEAMPKEGESLMIKYNKGKRKTVCYSEGYKGTLRVAKGTSVC